MRIKSIVSACALFIAFSGCVNPSGDVPGTLRHGINPSRFESVEYNWESDRIRVLFFRQSDKEPWQITIRDASDITDQSLEESNKEWTVTQCRCSAKAFAQIVDRSLTSFFVEKPQANVVSLAVEMQVVSEIWQEILAGLRQRLAAVKGEKPETRTEVPDEIDNEIGLVLERSTTIPVIKKVLAKHRLTVKAIQIPEHIIFKDSLAGKKWSDIAALPGLGVFLPGTFEFELSPKN